MTKSQTHHFRELAAPHLEYSALVWNGTNFEQIRESVKCFYQSDCLVYSGAYLYLKRDGALIERWELGDLIAEGMTAPIKIPVLEYHLTYQLLPSHERTSI